MKFRVAMRDRSEYVIDAYYLEVRGDAHPSYVFMGGIEDFEGPFLVAAFPVMLVDRVLPDRQVADQPPAPEPSQPPKAARRPASARTVQYG